MFGRNKKDPELEKVLASLMMNASNNYKDAAREDFKDLQVLFKRLDEAGKLSQKQKQYYEDKLKELSETMKGYSHGEQKQDYTGYRGTDARI